MSGTFRLFCCFTKVLFISGLSRTLYTPISMYQYEGDRVCMCIDFYDTLKMYRTRISSIMDLPIQEAASKGVGREERCGSIFFDIPEVSSTHCTPYSTARAWSNIFTQDQRLYRSFLHRTTSAVCKGHSPDPTGNRESCGSFSAKSPDSICRTHHCRNFLPSRTYSAETAMCTVHIQLRELVVDRADYTAPTGRHERDDTRPEPIGRERSRP